MRHAKRDTVDPPVNLVDPDAKGPRELEKVRAHMSDAELREKSFGFKAYKDDGVKAALHALFHGKCAYCESFYQAQAPVDVEHFRPKGAVEGEDDHDGYWWIAMAWDNLLPSCIDCNRRRRQQTPVAVASLTELHEGATETVSSGKKDAFPIGGTRARREGDKLDQEKPLLIDPSREDPVRFLEFHIDHDRPLGLVLPRTPPGNGGPPDAEADENAVRGAVSIQVYGLNRLGLVQERTRILRRLEFLRHLVTEIDDTAAKLSRQRSRVAKEAATRLEGLSDLIVQEMASMAEPDQPYSALARQWLEAFKAELSA